MSQRQLKSLHRRHNRHVTVCGRNYIHWPLPTGISHLAPCRMTSPSSMPSSGPRLRGSATHAPDESQESFLNVMYTMDNWAPAASFITTATAIKTSSHYGGSHLLLLCSSQHAVPNSAAVAAAARPCRHRQCSEGPLRRTSAPACPDPASSPAADFNVRLQSHQSSEQYGLLSPCCPSHHQPQQPR